MKLIRIIHVDSVAKARKTFVREVAFCNGVHFLGGFAEVSEVVSFLRANDVHLVFLDDKMKEPELGYLTSVIRDLPVNLVVLSSHNKGVLAAFEASALYCILKPVTKDKIMRAIDVWKHQKEKFTFTPHRFEEHLYEYMSQKNTFPKRLYLNTVGKTTVLQLEHLIYITSRDNYSQFMLADGAIHSSSRNIKNFADILKEHPDFIRIHKSHVINKRFVTHLIKEKNNKVFVEMIDGMRLEISPNRKEEILNEITG